MRPVHTHCDGEERRLPRQLLPRSSSEMVQSEESESRKSDSARRNPIAAAADS